MHDLQMVGSRTVVCGMHVHVEVPDLSARVDIMNRIQRYLPLLLALSTSSPFWQSQRTGLLGYRLAAYRELPRTGFPSLSRTRPDYQRYIDTLMAARAIENSSYVWWVIRPSLKHPTLELRVADSCTRLDDTLAIAALYRCLVRRLCVIRAQCRPDRRVAGDQRGEWLARSALWHPWQLRRRGRRAAPSRSGRCWTRLWTLVAEDAKALGCERELDLCRWIMARGTSADRQLSLYTEALGRGLSSRDALCRRGRLAVASENAIGGGISVRALQRLCARPHCSLARAPPIYTRSLKSARLDRAFFMR